MLNLLAIGSMAASLLVLPVEATAAQLDPPPAEDVTVSVVTVNGSGCPAGTASVKMNADKTAFTVTYSDYVAEDGGAALATEFRKNCQINVLVNIPQGFTYAIAQAEYRGYAKLSTGATAQQNAYYYIAGTSPTATVSHVINGPYSGKWSHSDVADAAALVYAPCGVQTNVNINTELRVRTTGTTLNWISMDKAHGEVDTVYHVSWKRC